MDSALLTLSRPIMKCLQSKLQAQSVQEFRICQPQLRIMSTLISVKNENYLVVEVACRIGNGWRSSKRIHYASIGLRESVEVQLACQSKYVSSLAFVHPAFKSCYVSIFSRSYKVCMGIFRAWPLTSTAIEILLPSFGRFSLTGNQLSSSR